MKDNEIGEIPIKGLLGQGLLKEIPRSKKMSFYWRGYFGYNKSAAEGRNCFSRQGRVSFIE
ncbi:MAG: hypothetical protein ACYS9Y_08660 [Planctomycetota bacterium]|jgi:hypothetical protein